MTFVVLVLLTLPGILVTVYWETGYPPSDLNVSITLTDILELPVFTVEYVIVFTLGSAGGWGGAI